MTIGPDTRLSPWPDGRSDRLDDEINWAKAYTAKTRPCETMEVADGESGCHYHSDNAPELI